MATDVEAADASFDGAEARLRTLEPGAGIGLWILPNIEISAASIRYPLDLVFLNSDCVVLAIVESFPLASPPASSAKAFSVLALPADTVAEGSMRAGDQLIIAEPDEMKRHLRRMKEAKVKSQNTVGPFPKHSANKPSEEQTMQVGEALARSVVEQKAAEPNKARLIETGLIETGPTGTGPTGTGLIEAVPAAAKIAREELSTAGAAAVSPSIENKPWMRPAGSRNWFTRLLLGDPADPRKATREQIPGLIAYFFTGGSPVGYELRDISSTGMYIVTHHRWYPGTVVRVTLTDRKHPTPARTITVNAKAVRVGRDGVGFEFILGTEKRKKGELPPLEERTLGLDAERLEAFLQKLKA